MKHYFAVLFLVYLLVIPRCNCCTFPADLTTTTFTSFKYPKISLAPSVESVGMYTNSSVLTYTTGPITVAATETPKSYTCIQSCGDFYLFKSTQPVDDLAVGIIDVYMCQKVIKVDDGRYLVYYFGERTVANPNENALTKGTATFRPVGTPVPSKFMCDVCSLHRFGTTDFPSDFPAQVVVLGARTPSLTGVTPQVNETSPPICKTPPLPCDPVPAPSTPKPAPTPSTPKPEQSPSPSMRKSKVKPNEFRAFCKTFINFQVPPGQRKGQKLRSYLRKIKAQWKRQKINAAFIQFVQSFIISCAASVA